VRDRVMMRAAGVVCVVLLTACDGGGSPPSVTPRSIGSPAATPLRRAHDLGLGEPRQPEPFTVPQRLLDAVSRGDRATIDRALERGAPLSAKDDLGRSVVLLAVLDAGDLDLVRWLHTKGAALDEADSGGRTALSFAAANGQLDIVRYLLEHGAAVERADVQRRSPLFHAALGDHAAVVGVLLDQGANVNARDQFGDTALIVACAKGNAATAALLLQRGADASLTDQEGRTARERAAPGTAVCLMAGATASAR
jgi:hypothetical protein